MPPESPSATDTLAGAAPTSEDSATPVAELNRPFGSSPTPGRSGRWPPWLVRPLVIYLVSRVVTLAAFAFMTIFTHTSISGEINRWDSRWFLRAAANGWPSQLPYSNGHVAGNTIAFFPLFPLTIRWTSHLTRLSLLSSGITISAIMGLTATIGVWMLVRHYADQNTADRATLLVFMFPGALVLSMVYSEGMVVTCVAFGLLALLHRRWWLAGILGMLATAISPIALAFALSCAWCAYREVTKNRNWRALAAPILAPVGFVAYQLWLWWHTGDLLAWRDTERGGWNSYPSLAYPIHTVTSFFRDPIASNITNDILFAGIVVTAIATVLAIRSRMPVPMLVYGVTAAVLALISAPVDLRPRFIFLAFPLIVAVGARLRGRAYIAVLSVSIISLCLLTGLEVYSLSVFP